MIEEMMKCVLTNESFNRYIDFYGSFSFGNFEWKIQTFNWIVDDFIE